MKPAFLILSTTLLLCRTLVTAQPLDTTGPKKAMPDQWIDQDTHHKVVRLSRKDGNNLSFYFHNNPFIDGKMIFYTTDDNGKQLYTVDLKTLQLTRVSPSNGNAEIVGHHSKSVYFQSHDSVFNTSIETGNTRLVYTFPADFKGAISTLNADETLLAGGWASDEQREISRKYPEKHDFFDRIFDAHLPNKLFTINLKTGELKVIHTENTWLGHIQFSPTDPGLLMFCHEGPWQKVDRIWTIRMASGETRLMHKRTVENEIAGHEFFSPDGKTIFFDWQIPKGQTFYLGGVDIATGAEKKYALTRNEWSIHFNVSADEKLFCGDGGDAGQVAKAPDGRWIYLFHPDGDHFVSEKLVNMKDQFYKLEPNVHFSPDGKWVIFRANFEGKEEVYAVECARAPPEEGTSAQLQWPAITSQTKPWTRWWWMGSAVDQPNLTANLEKYKAAGLGGLELTPMYGVHGYETQFVDYLSPKWIDLFSFTLHEAKRLDLGIDMSTGTGWPFGGGPLIDSTYACREMFHKTWTVKGGTTFTDTIRFQQEPLVHTDGRPTTIDQLIEPVFATKDLQSLALFQVRFPHSLPPLTLMAYGSNGESLDLTSKVDATGRLSWTAPPGADWTLYALFLGWHGKMVERAAPGAEGNVIDHFSSSALHKYLSRFDTAFAGHDLTPLRCFFNDSYEVDDSRGQSNWTAAFFEAFQHYRGYDLRQHLPALFGNGTPDNNTRVICDYRETISDLLLEQFTQPWHDWARSKGARIRNQAHGSPANILDLYAASDIPETEGADILRYKFATSAAHVTGKPLVSSESVTWLNEHFISSYADVKTALDKYWLGGVNHVFYHGTAYTPTDDPWPGWLFYASVHFTPNDPDWSAFPTLNAYVARIQSFLQEGSPDNDILLYYPLYDSWSDVPGAPDAAKGSTPEANGSLLKHYDRMDPEFTGAGFKECAEYLQSKGYAFDYISDKQIRQLQPNTHYHTILLPDCRYLSLAALQKLTELATEGFKVLVYKTLPTSPPGYSRFQQRNTAFQQLLLQNKFTISTDLAGLFTTTHTRRESLTDDSLDFVRRTYDNGNIYFIVNHGSKAFAAYAPLATRFTIAAIFDPMTGEKGLARQKAQTVYLRLLPGQSILIQTNPTQTAPLFPYYQPSANPISLKGEWQLKFLSGGPKVPPTVTTKQLGSWTALDGDAYKSFSGTAKYTLTFSRPAGHATAWLLDLGEVDRTAEVSLNGKKLFTLIGPNFQLTVPASAIQDRNTLEIIVSNGMVNRIEDMDRKGLVYKKIYNYNFPAHERANRGANGLFDASKWTPIASGLTGPVTLTPLHTLP